MTSAQEPHSLNGLVVDENNLPLPGAVVLLNMGEKAAVSGKDGRFRLIADYTEQVFLEVSFIGYCSYSKKISLDSITGTLKIMLQPSVRQLNEVVINDQYSVKRRKEDTKSVELVGQEYILQNMSGSLMKTLDRIPGLTTMDIGSGQSKPVIRGLGFNRVVVTDQGVKHEGQQWGADHGLEIDQYAVELAEVIKGPGSLLYGSDAIGGLIELSQETIPEDHGFGGSVNLSGKSNNGLVGGSLQLSGRKGQWYAKGRITALDYGDYRVPVDSVTINSYRVPLYKHWLRNTAGEEFDAHLTVGLIRKKFTSSVYISDVYNRSGFFANAQGIMPLITDSTYDRSNRDIQLPYQWVNHLKAISRSVLFHGLWKSESEIGFQNNVRQELNRYIGHGYMPAVLPDSLGFPPGLAREFRKNIFSLNLRTTRMIFSKHSLTGGINAEYQHNRIGGWSFIIPSFDQITTGIFLINKFQMNENFILLGGIRYDIGFVSIKSYNDWFKTPSFSGTDTTWSYAQRAAQLSRTFGSLSWSAGFSYSKWALTLKINIGKSFRMPTPKELAVNGVNYHYFIYEKGNPGLSPEVSYQLDAGLEWNIPKFALVISPFVNYFPNYIFLNPTYFHDYTYGAGNQVYQYTQGRVFRWGSELQVHYQLFKRLMTGLIVEYVYSRQLSGDKKGFTLPFSPPASMIVDLKYIPNLGKHFINAFLSLDLNLTAAQNQIVPPEQKTPGYIVVDILMGTDIRVGKQIWKVNIQLQNLFNIIYYNHSSFYRLMEVPEPSRNFSLNILIPFAITAKQ